tara:strand:+ start:826 stop:1563 length:738 start_codon:yes stop_codon:yes gene_type:complete
MASIYSDEMKEKILTDFSSKNPKVSASIIERFGENPMRSGVGSLNVEQYRDMVDAPLQNNPIAASNGTALNNYFEDWLRNNQDNDKLKELMIQTSEPSDVDISGLGDYTPVEKENETTQEPAEKKKISTNEVVGLVAALYGLSQAGKDIKAPAKAPRYKAPKPTEIKGVGRIGRASDGGTVLNRKLFLGGGEVDGIGGPKSDLVPIWASDQEYVVSANGVKRMGGGDHSRGIAALDDVNNNGRLV